MCWPGQCALAAGRRAGAEGTLRQAVEICRRRRRAGRAASVWRVPPAALDVSRAGAGRILLLARRRQGGEAVAEPPVTFADLLRQLRTEARLTQEELAEAAS